MTILSLAERRKTAPPSPEAEFWAWFAAHEDMVWNCHDDVEHVFPLVLGRLERVHPDLAFDLGRVAGGRRELVLTACGMAAAFPAVIRLAAAAPLMERWIIRALRPRRPVEGQVEGCGQIVRLEEVRFTAERLGGKLKLDLFIPGYRRTYDDEFEGLGSFLVDLAVGEFDAQMHVAGITVFAPRPDLESRPLSDLPALVDALPRN